MLEFLRHSTQSLFTERVFVNVAGVIVDDLAVDNVAETVVHVNRDRVGHSNKQINKEASLPVNQQILHT